MSYFLAVPATDDGQGRMSYFLAVPATDDGQGRLSYFLAVPATDDGQREDVLLPATDDGDLTVTVCVCESCVILSADSNDSR